MHNKLTKTVITLLIIMTVPTSVLFAGSQVQCQAIINKDPSWSQESVKVDIVDFNSKKIIQSMNLSAATQAASSINTLTQPYDCNKYPKIQFQASYTPSIWSTDKGQVYQSNAIYDLSHEILMANLKGTKILEVTLTFPTDFIGVPLLVN